MRAAPRSFESDGGRAPRRCPGTRAGLGARAGSPGCLIFFVRGDARAAERHAADRTPLRWRAEGPQCAFGFDRWGFCAARSTGVWNRPAQPPAPAKMDPAACVARRTRSRRTEAKAAAPKAAVARVSQSVEGPPSELRKPAVTQPDTGRGRRRPAGLDPRSRTNSAAAEPHTGGDAERASTARRRPTATTPSSRTPWRPCCRLRASRARARGQTRAVPAGRKVPQALFELFISGATGDVPPGVARLAARL